MKTVKRFRFPRLAGRVVSATNFGHLLLVHLLSLLAVLLFDCGYAKLAGLFVIVLFNLNSWTHSKLDGLDHRPDHRSGQATGQQAIEQPFETTSFEWLQAIIDQLWPGDLAASFQRELNKFYTKNRNTEYKFYHFYLNETQPPRLDQIHVPSESTRSDEAVLHFRLTLLGTALIRLSEESEQDKAERSLIDRLIGRYGFRRRSQTGTYQDAKLKKKHFLVKELYLNGRSRIVFRPLSNHAPFFTSLSFSLLDYPAMYSKDRHDPCESSDEFEQRLYHYLIERICLPFLCPNRLVLLYTHRDYIKLEHGRLLRQKLSETNQFVRTKLRRLIRNRPKVGDFMQELSDHKIVAWYKANVVKELDLVELQLNCCTYHPAPLYVLRVRVIEAENLRSNCVMFVRVRVGQLSVAKVRLVHTGSPVLNLTALLPLHDHYERCSVQLFEIRSHDVKTIKRCTGQLSTPLWNQPIVRLPKDHQLIRPLSEVCFPIDSRTFGCDESSQNLNGQDFWLPLDGARKSMIHLSCACFRLSAALRTIRKVSRITRTMMITKGDLNHNQLPIAFVKLYAENFVCTYKKDSQLKSRRNQFNQLEFSLAGKTKAVDLMKLTKTRSIFRNGCHLFVYDDPFNSDLVVELANRSKRTDFVHENDGQDSKIRLLNLVSLSDYKGKLHHNEKLSIYIVNSKDFDKSCAGDKKAANFKLIDKEEFGKLTLNLFIGFVCLDSGVLQRLLLAPELRGQCLDGRKRAKRQTKLTKKDKKLLLDQAASSNRRKRKSLPTGECVGKLYFKLLNSHELVIGVVHVQNAPYDQTKQRVKLQVAVELWKGNQKVSVKRTPFTEIVHNPTFDSSFQFAIDSGHLQQYAVRLVVVQRSGLFRTALKIIADRFCTIPLLTMDANFVIRSYRLKTDNKISDKRLEPGVSSKNPFNFK